MPQMQPKTKIENEQRALRRERAENNETWNPEFFEYENFVLCQACIKNRIIWKKFCRN